MPRWTIITEDGLTMLREDIFTREEAQAFAAANPTTPNGTPQFAVTERVARICSEHRKRLRAELEQRYTDTMEAIVARVMYTELPDDPIISTEDADRLNHPYQP